MAKKSKVKKTIPKKSRMAALYCHRDKAAGEATPRPAENNISELQDLVFELACDEAGHTRPNLIAPGRSNSLADLAARIRAEQEAALLNMKLGSPEPPRARSRDTHPRCRGLIVDRQSE